MARRSVLVYDLLRTEQPPDGFSQKEILTRIASKYDIAATKTLARDVAIALRRGLDFGILAKKRNKFRLQTDFHQAARRGGNVRRNARRRRGKSNSRTSRRTSGGSTAGAGRRQDQRRRSAGTRRGRQRKTRSGTVPRPKLPQPPSWSPKRRYLADEPIPKVIKHSRNRRPSSSPSSDS